MWLSGVVHDAIRDAEEAHIDPFELAGILRSIARFVSGRSGQYALDKRNGGKMLAPWHDTPTCINGVSPENPSGACGGPLVPVSQERPLNAANPAHVKCAACGHDYVETNPRMLAAIWWSAGAWSGQYDKYILFENEP